MSYINQADYKELLAKFVMGCEKQVLQEGYIDLIPINSLKEEVPTKMSHIYAKYPEAMEGAKHKIKNPGKYSGGPRSHFDTDGDGVPNGADENPTDGAIEEADETSPGSQIRDAYSKHRDGLILLQLVKDIAKKNNFTKEQVLATASKFGASEYVMSQIEQMFPATAAGDMKEGLYGDGPQATDESRDGLGLGNLSLSEREKLKSYAESMKTIRRAIQELLDKAKVPKMEGGDMTNLTLN